MSLLLVNANSLKIPLADKSVHCVVTSPPYWGLRDYGIDDQIGLEQTPEDYVSNMVAVTREVWRVLRDDGTLWLNLGDSYATSGDVAEGGSEKQRSNKGANNIKRDIKSELRPKNLVGIPWRVAFALQADGWYLRSDIIWSKPNPMPESVTDRPTKAHEYLFLLAKSQRYYYDQDAIREDFIEEHGGIVVGRGVRQSVNIRGGFNPGMDRAANGGYPQTHEGRNKRTVWDIPTAPYSGAHFATFPPALIEPCIKAGTSEKGCCPICGNQWEREIDRTPPGRHESEYQTIASGRGNGGDKSKHAIPSINRTVGWQPSCEHDLDPIPSIVLDPFAGSGTTLMVSRQLGRSAIGIDLSYPYLRDQARERLQLTALEEWEFGKKDGNSVQDLPIFQILKEST